MNINDQKHLNSRSLYGLIDTLAEVTDARFDIERDISDRKNRVEALNDTIYYLRAELAERMKATGQATGGIVLLKGRYFRVSLVSGGDRADLRPVPVLVDQRGEGSPELVDDVDEEQRS